MISRQRRIGGSVSVWPGYVDALSALLMVVIFVILIFTISQFLLNEILSGQESELASLHRRVKELVTLLGLEKERSDVLQSDIKELSGSISSLTQEKEALQFQVAERKEKSLMDTAEIKRQFLLIASLQEDIDALSRLRSRLEQRVGELAGTLKEKGTEIGVLRDRSKALETMLASERERTLLAQREIEQREIRIQALSALTQAQDQALKEERRLTADARAEVTLLNRQIENLRHQLEEIGRALKVAEAEKSAQKTKLEELGKRLNIVLAREVNRLERYRSEFFGRLREVIGENPYVRVEGDRFVLQAELLFDTASADLGEKGKGQLLQLAESLHVLTKKIPQDIDWILRIDGHTDRIPINNERFASNWELSTARALSVVKFLADQGIPENRMAAAGFSKFHPIDPSNTPEAFRKNRRIEIKLTSR
ncbi:MAG: peptidoglycan -binding protein [Deltaproteobacteria bacterium]|nr:peptidoglycan -binding protein [Deltaproteobacteria bacterium]MBW2208014.1 peptidoglycan -binding protein [Deltaproteobacteria bacterium]